MAGHDLIDAYLDELRDALRWRPDVEDLLAEAEDHLRESADRLEGSGATPADAERDSIAAFGHPALVARAHATTSAGSVALPTGQTRTAGVVAIVAAACWVLVPTFWILSGVVEDSTGDWTGAPQVLGTLGALSLLLAGALTAVSAVGLITRHGGLGPVGTSAVVLLVLGTVMSVIGWFLAGWMTLSGLGLGLLAGAMAQRQIAPKVPTVLLGAGLLAGLTAFLATRALEVGRADQWGDYRAPSVIGLVLACGLTAAGLAGTGRWLASEQPAPAPLPAYSDS